MQSIIDFLGFSQSINIILDDLILKGELNTVYDVSRSLSSKSYYKSNIGNELSIKIDQVDLIKQGMWKREGVKTLLIDGVIETVSQIHHLLERASSKKQPMMVICRNASSEVKKTVNLNFLRGTIDLLLLEVGFEVEYHHFFEDCRVLFDCDYVNIKMGDTISSKIDDLEFTIDGVIATSNSLNLKNSNIKKNKILNYISDVKSIKDTIRQEKIDADELTNILNSINSRIKFLSSSRVDIKIGKNDVDNDPYTIAKIDRFFRSFPDIGFTGVVDVNDLKNCDPVISLLRSTQGESLLTQRQVFQSMISSFKIYETIVKAEKIFTKEII
jgi:hypothetical protein